MRSARCVSRSDRSTTGRVITKGLPIEFLSLCSITSKPWSVPNVEPTDVRGGDREHY